MDHLEEKLLVMSRYEEERAGFIQVGELTPVHLEIPLTGVSGARSAGEETRR